MIKKKISIFSLCMLVLLCACSCNKQEESSKETEKVEEKTNMISEKDLVGDWYRKKMENLLLRIMAMEHAHYQTPAFQRESVG